MDPVKWLLCWLDDVDCLGQELASSVTQSKPVFLLSISVQLDALQLKLVKRKKKKENFSWLLPNPSSPLHKPILEIQFHKIIVQIDTVLRNIFMICLS